MCGVSGLVIKASDFDRQKKLIKNRLTKLTKLAGRRGQDSLGLALISSDGVVSPKFTKGNLQNFLSSKKFTEHIEAWTDIPGAKAAFVFNRLQIVGDKSVTENNGPIQVDDLWGMHNGIVCNGPKLWESIGRGSPELDVDSEVLFKALNSFWPDNNISGYLSFLKEHLEGSFTIAAYKEALSEFLFATNTGSLYFAESEQAFAFSSEKHFLIESRINDISGSQTIRRLEPWSHLVVNFDPLSESANLTPVQA